MDDGLAAEAGGLMCWMLTNKTQENKSMRLCLNRSSEDSIRLGPWHGPDTGILPAAGKFHAPEVGKVASGNDQEPTSSMRQLVNLNHCA